MTTPIDPNYRHPKCYANLHGGCSTKISGEHYISHSLIKLYTFNDPDVRVIRNSGFGIRHDWRAPRRTCDRSDSLLGADGQAATSVISFASA